MTQRRWPAVVVSVGLAALPMGCSIDSGDDESTDAAPDLASGRDLASGGDAGSSFFTPDIVDNESFETGWGPFENWSGGVPPQNVTRDNTLAYAGSWSALRTWAPSSIDVGTQFANYWSPSDRVWVRFYFRLTNHVTTIMKFSRLYGSVGFDTNLGGVALQRGSDIFGWGWDQEDASIVATIGLTESQVIDGQWHSLEYDYWRNGDPSGFPSAAFWFDGNPQFAELNGHSTVSGWGAGNKSYWQNGRLYAGERLTGTVKLGTIEWLATLNGGNTTSGQCNLDRIAVSSIGRIGP
jgi:hypothetical protein